MGFQCSLIAPASPQSPNGTVFQQMKRDSERGNTSPRSPRQKPAPWISSMLVSESHRQESDQ